MDDASGLEALRPEYNPLEEEHLLSALSTITCSDSLVDKSVQHTLLSSSTFNLCSLCFVSLPELQGRRRMHGLYPLLFIIGVGPHREHQSPT
jgi:hypothetical protein